MQSLEAELGRHGREIMDCVSTDDALEILDGEGMIGKTMELIIPKIEFHMNHRVRGGIKVGAITFSSQYGTLGMTPSAAELLKHVGDRD